MNQLKNANSTYLYYDREHDFDVCYMKKSFRGRKLEKQIGPQIFAPDQ